MWYGTALLLFFPLVNGGAVGLQSIQSRFKFSYQYSAQLALFVFLFLQRYLDRRTFPSAHLTLAKLRPGQYRVGRVVPSVIHISRHTA